MVLLGPPPLPFYLGNHGGEAVNSKKWVSTLKYLVLYDIRCPCDNSSNDTSYE